MWVHLRFSGQKCFSGRVKLLIRMVSHTLSFLPCSFSVCLAVSLSYRYIKSHSMDIIFRIYYSYVLIFMNFIELRHKANFPGSLEFYIICHLKSGKQRSLPGKRESGE